MNRLSLLILATLWLPTCLGRYHTEAPAVTINPTSNKPLANHTDTLNINLLKSTINWTATEMKGLKKRTGKISLSKAYLLVTKHRIVGGNFVVNMNTMDVTDIPAHEVAARKNLIAHLRSADFFHTDQYPTATLMLTNVEKTAPDRLKISGNFTIRDVTKNITFTASQNKHTLKANFTFNRLDWKVAYTGSWANKTLVDNDIELAIELVFKAKP
ncbi:YceI family protein [Pedobacter nanyangensis]|uniref:YceI family protein n=1 Tax=Pedobacter nanyangensis TaxID=1562389 RepID=UPI000DE20466|nr:YceI family protein [Pedobacter nanyangensis]